MHDQPIADAGLDQRPWKTAVIRPDMNGLTANLHVSELRRQIDLDDLRVGVAIDRLVERQLVSPAGWGERLRRGQGGCHRTNQQRKNQGTGEHTLEASLFS